MMFILTYPNGDAAWFKGMAELLESIEYDAFGLQDCKVYRIDHQLDINADVEAALRDYDEALAWDSDHEDYVSSPEKTGRV